MEQPTTFYHFPPLLSKKWFNIVEEIGFDGGYKANSVKFTGINNQIYSIDYQIIKIYKVKQSL